MKKYRNAILFAAFTRARYKVDGPPPDYQVNATILDEETHF